MHLKTNCLLLAIVFIPDMGYSTTGMGTAKHSFKCSNAQGVALRIWRIPRTFCKNLVTILGLPYNLSVRNIPFKCLSVNMYKNVFDTLLFQNMNDILAPGPKSVQGLFLMLGI